MDYFRKNKLLGILVLLLVVVNITVLALLWFQKGTHKRGPGRDGSRHGQEFLEMQLNLSDEQLQQVKQMRRDHFGKMQSLHEASRDARKKLHGLWNVENSEANAENAANEIGRIHGQIELQTYRHFAGIREILNETQKEKFDEIITEVLLRGGPDRQGPPGGPPGRGDRPPPRRR